MTYRMVYPSDPLFPEVEREMKSPTPRTCGRQIYYTDHRRHVPDGPTTGGIDNTPRHIDDGTVCKHEAKDDHLGVHVTHCCRRHGCKYDRACPVTRGEVLQEYPCEHCLSPDEARAQLVEALDEYAWSCSLYGRLEP